jgi:hypothetical protein
MDTTKWSAVVISKETHYKLKDLSKAYNLSMARTMEHLLTTAWNEMYAYKPKVYPKQDNTKFRSKA